MQDIPFAITDLDGLVLRTGAATDILNASIQANGEDEVCHVGFVAEEGDRIVDGKVIPKPVELPVITVEMVKEEQARRLRYTDWVVTRAADPTDGRPVPDSILAERAAIRDGAAALEAMDPIPPDYRDDRHWR